MGPGSWCSTCRRGRRSGGRTSSSRPEPGWRWRRWRAGRTGRAGGWRVAGPGGVGQDASRARLGEAGGRPDRARRRRCRRWPLGELAADAALAVEDADRIRAGRGAEEMLFHVCNHLGAGGGSLMVSGRLPPAQMADRAARSGEPAERGAGGAAGAAGRRAARGGAGEAVCRPAARGGSRADPRTSVGRMDRSFAAAEALVGRARPRRARPPPAAHAAARRRGAAR